MLALLITKQTFPCLSIPPNIDVILANSIPASAIGAYSEMKTWGIQTKWFTRELKLQVLVMRQPQFLHILWLELGDFTKNVGFSVCFVGCFSFFEGMFCFLVFSCFFLVCFAEVPDNETCLQFILRHVKHLVLAEPDEVETNR